MRYYWLMGNILDHPDIIYETPSEVAPQKATDAPLIEIGEGQPLDYLLAVLRHPDETPARRMAAAEKAAPYVHPKLAASVVVTGNGPLQVIVQRFGQMTANELAALGASRDSKPILDLTAISVVAEPVADTD